MLGRGNDRPDSQALEPEVPARDPEPAVAERPQTRRALLAGALGSLAGLVAGRLGQPDPTRAAAGNPILMGTNNLAGDTNTQLTTSTSGRAFEVIQNGSGAAIRGKGLKGNGGHFVTAAWNKFAFMAQHDGTGTGDGGAISARGKRNHGIVASTDSADRTGLTAVNTSVSADDVAITGLAYNAAPADTHPSGAQAFFKAAGEFAGINGIIGASIPAADTGVGVAGISPGGHGFGVYGQASSTDTGLTFGVFGQADGSQGTGVYGYAPAGSGAAWGVWGQADGSGIGVYGQSDTGYAIYGLGDVYVAGTLSKAGGSFKIDHPLDPANQYLQHSFVESPDMKNVYDGVVTTDAQGEATVELPDWFEALNEDFRYQLTPIGDWAEAWVGKEIKHNRFTIATRTPNTKVSWQVTGIRHDAWAEQHRIEVEVAKTGEDKGKYLHPVEHGQPKRKGVDYAAQQRARAAGRRAQSGAAPSR